MQRLQQWMTENGKSQRPIAKECGVSQPTVWAWLRGEANPSVENLKKLSGITGLTIDELVDNVPAKPVSNAPAETAANAPSVA
jgi:transcriptional regulator with XRE-family HTH domain